jgi:hypothetical protein
MSGSFKTRRRPIHLSSLFKKQCMKKTIVFSLAATVLVLLTGCQKDINPAERDVQELKSGKATIWVQNVQLSGLNEVPINDLGATGEAILRLTADSVLHSKVNVYLTEGSGDLTAAHIHEGAAGTNGSVKIFLCHDASDFGVFQHTKLTEAQYTLLMDQSKFLYVNAHSTTKPPGLVRGQIR